MGLLFLDISLYNTALELDMFARPNKEMIIVSVYFFAPGSRSVKHYEVVTCYITPQRIVLTFVFSLLVTEMNQLQPLGFTISK